MKLFQYVRLGSAAQILYMSLFLAGYKEAAASLINTTIIVPQVCTVTATQTFTTEYFKYTTVTVTKTSTTRLFVTATIAWNDPFPNAIVVRRRNPVQARPWIAMVRNNNFNHSVSTTTHSGKGPHPTTTSSTSVSLQTTTTSKVEATTVHTTSITSCASYLTLVVQTTISTCLCYYDKVQLITTDQLLTEEQTVYVRGPPPPSVTVTVTPTTSSTTSSQTSSRTPLVAPQEVVSPPTEDKFTTTIGSDVFTITSISPGSSLAINGATTLSPGAALTTNGIVLSNSAGGLVVKTVDADPLAPSTTTIGTLVYTISSISPGSSLVLNGATTLTPGAAFTTNGVVLSNSAGALAITTIGESPGSVIASIIGVIATTTPQSNSFPTSIPISILASGSGIVIGGTTMTPGGTIVNGDTTYILPTGGRTVLVAVPTATKSSIAVSHTVSAPGSASSRTSPTNVQTAGAVRERIVGHIAGLVTGLLGIVMQFI